MHYAEYADVMPHTVASQASIDARLGFIRRTYAHLALAIVAYVALTGALLFMPFTPAMVGLMLGSSYSWLVVLGLFMATGWVADWWAHNVEYKPMQYLGLALGVFGYAVVTVPMVYMAIAYSSPSVLPKAAITTLAVFSGLTGFVFVTKRDFSMLRMGIFVGGLLAMGAIVLGAIFGFNLGLGFSIAMVGLAAAFVIYSTSNVLHHYRTDQHVGASLALFSSIALMFWYVLRIFMARD